MLKTIQRSGLFLVFCGCLSLPTSVKATGIVNGDFETGNLTGWNVGVPPGGSAVYSGSAGNSAGAGGPSPSTTYADLRYDLGTALSTPEEVFPGIYLTYGAPFVPFLQQTFNANVGDTLSFAVRWDIGVSNPDGGGGGFDVDITGPAGEHYRYEQSASRGPLPTGGTGWYGTPTSDWLTITYLIQESGPHQFLVQPFAYGFTSHSRRWGSSVALGVDNVQLIAVPEPSSWALIVVGFVAMGVVGARLRRQVRP